MKIDFWFIVCCASGPKCCTKGGREADRESGDNRMKRRGQMMIHRAQAMAVVASALMWSMNAYAGNKAKPVATTTESVYNFRCVGPTLDLTLASFSLPVSRPAASAASGGAAKPATSTLTIEFPASKAYSTLFSQIIHGDHYSSCTLVETVAVPASAGVAASTTVFTWIFGQVTPTVVTAIWKDGSEAGSANAGNSGANLPSSLVRATFTFGEVRFGDGSTSKSSTATDSWTLTQ